MDLRNFGLSEDELRQLGYKVSGEGRRTDESDAGRSQRPGRDDARPAPRRRASPALRVWLTTLAVLTAVGWLSALGRGLPDPVPVAGPDVSFSSGRALAQLVEIAQRPHPTGSPDLVRVRSNLLGRLSALGLESELQITTAHVRDSSFVRAATVRNIVARVPGSESTGAMALVAHYDAAPLSPGAGDNALGVATLLEVVRAIQAGEPLRNDLIVVLTDADEIGLLGSRAFAQRHPWADDVAVTVSVESRGTSGPAVLFESLDGNGALIETMGAAGRGATSLAGPLAGSALESATGVADRAPPSLALTVLGGRAWEDGTRDTRDRVSERTLQHGGEQLMGLVRGLGALDLRRDLDAPDQTYLSPPLLGFVHYPSVSNFVASLGLVLLWAFVGLVVRLRRGGRNGVLVGLGLGAATVALSAAAGSTLLGFLVELHPEYGTLRTALYRDGPHILALAALSLALTSVLYTVARRWGRWDEILFGALALPLAYVVWLTFATPAAAPLAQWALAPALVGTVMTTVLGPRRGGSVWSWAVILLLTAVSVALAVPGLELVAQAWTLRGATALGALLGLAMLLLLPVMDWLRRPRVWATPLANLAVAAALVALHLPSVQGAVDHPGPTTLVYLTDEAASTDPILRSDTVSDGDSRARTVLGSWLTVPGPGEEWARSWVGDPPAGSTDPGVLLIGPDSLYEIAGTAPDAELAPPTVTLVSSTPAGDRRDVVLDVRSGLRGEMLGIVIPDEAAAELTGVGNAAWPVGGVPVRRMVHWGVPEGEALRVGLSIPGDALRAELVVLEHHLRPKEVLGDYFFQRGDSIVPNAAMGSDRVIQRTSVAFEIPAATPSPLGGEQAPGSQGAL